MFRYIDIDDLLMSIAVATSGGITIICLIMIMTHIMTVDLNKIEQQKYNACVKANITTQECFRRYPHKLTENKKH